jgi:hypothetical protein
LVIHASLTPSASAKGGRSARSSPAKLYLDSLIPIPAVTALAAGGIRSRSDNVSTTYIQWTVDDDDFRQGMAALRNSGDSIDQSAAVSEEIDWFVFLWQR